METLPIRYFDTHAHGDIMSTYTNDVDAIRELRNNIHIYKMDFNKTRLEEIKKDIMEVENKIQANKSLIGEKESSILQLRNETRTLTSRLGQEICIDYSIIKTNMTEFFAGWITQMNVLCLPSSNLQQAQQIFDSTIQSLITT